MGSKARPRSHVASCQDDDPEAAQSDGVEHQTLVMRIAEALQVPTNTFYAQPDGARPMGECPAPADAAALDAECATLLEAYRRIRDPFKRQQLLLLVQMSTLPNGL